MICCPPCVRHDMFNRIWCVFTVSRNELEVTALRGYGTGQLNAHNTNSCTDMGTLPELAGCLGTYDGDYSTVSCSPKPVLLPLATSHPIHIIEQYGVFPRQEKIKFLAEADC